MKLNIITLLSGSIIFLMISLSIQTCRVNKAIKAKDIAEADRATAIQFANDQKNVTESYINKFNNVVARTKTVEISLSNVVALRNSERLKFLNEIDGLKRNLKNLESGITIDAEIDEDSIPVSVVYLPCKDSVKVFNYELVDDWNLISAMVVDTPKFEIKVPIRSAIYWERKRKVLWFRMGPKQYYIESFSPNRLIEITGQEVLRVQKKK